MEETISTNEASKAYDTALAYAEDWAREQAKPEIPVGSLWNQDLGPSLACQQQLQRPRGECCCDP